MHWVFAYGSNMHLRDVRRWLRERGYPRAAPAEVVPARIRDFALAWNYRSASRQGGAANVVPCPGAEVRGVALGVDAPLLAAIDRKEGHPTRYDRGGACVAARTLDGGRTLDTWLYRVTPAHTSDRVVPPRAAYLRLLVEAAVEHRLGDDYVALLRRTPTVG